MLEDLDTLQFILDTVQKIGGAPHNLETLQEEAVDPGAHCTVIMRLTYTEVHNMPIR